MAKQEQIIEKLEMLIGLCKEGDQDTNEASWGYETGVLITANDAQDIIELLNCLHNSPLTEEQIRERAKAFINLKDETEGIDWTEHPNELAGAFVYFHESLTSQSEIPTEQPKQQGKCNFCLHGWVPFDEKPCKDCLETEGKIYFQPVQQTEAGDKKDSIEE